MLWITTLASNFGTVIQAAGAAWLMTLLTSSAQTVALVQTATTFPVMLLGLPAGALADNFNRRHVMLFAQAAMLLVSAALALVAFAGLLNPWILLGLVFLAGCGSAIHGPAWQASVGELVPRSAVPSAVALNSMSFNIARSLGPAAAGVIISLAGAAVTFLVNALTYLGLIAALALWRPTYAARPLPREPVADAMAAGIRFAAFTPVIRQVLARAGLFCLAASAVPALLPLVALELLEGGPIVYGLLLGAFGAGAVLGALGSGRLRRILATETIVRACAVALAGGAACVGFSQHILLTVAALMIVGAAWLLTLSTMNVIVQLEAPQWVLARALALYQVSAFGGAAIGSWLFGLVAEQAGLGFSLSAAALCQTLVVATGLRARLPEPGTSELGPQTRWVEPELDTALGPRAGPILVIIRYRIEKTAVPDFLEAMRERSRIKRRDGVRHWKLWRNLSEPGLWIEQYELRDWIGYVRHHQRRTQADAANSDRLLALHSGPNEPEVKRYVSSLAGPSDEGAVADVSFPA